MFCPKCGFSLKDGEKFCRECGAPISQLIDNNENREEVSAAIEDNAIQSQGLTESDEQPDSDKYYEKAHDHKGITRKAIIIAIISILFLLLAGIGFVKYSGASTLRNEIKLGNKYLQEGKYEEAVLAFQKAIKIEPKSVEARVGLGKAYIGSGKIDLAEKAFKEAISINAKKPQAYIELAKLYENEGKTNDAIAILEKGYSATGNSSIKKMLDEIKAKQNQKITFEDKEFEKMIRKIINKETGDITAADLEKVESISITGNMARTNNFVSWQWDWGAKSVKYTDEQNNLHSEKGSIKNIDDLKWFPNLKTLLIGYNEISDISVVSKLTKLESLQLPFNHIQSIEAIGDLKNLKAVEVMGNQIKDISILKQLPKIETLFLQENQIDDINVLKENTNIKVLYLDGNNLTDISILNKFKNLSNLGLGHNHIRDISALRELINLKQLEIGMNNLTDISPLTNLKNLEELDLSDNKIENISVLRELSNLKQLYIMGNPIGDYSPLDSLKNTKIDK